MKRTSEKKGTKRSQKFQSVTGEKASFAYVESYKTLRTNLDFVSSVNGAQSILVTSAIPNESKSTTALNLAITFARSGYAVIVVECDLRKPILRKYLNLGWGTKGLSSFLSSNASLEECIVDIEDLGISVIHAGNIPPNPSELLDQDKMGDMIAVLKKQYDYILLDAPPIAVVTDAAVVSRVSDGALLVVRSKFAPTKTVRLAKQRLEAVNVKIMGVVLTRFNIKKSGWKSGYSYNDYNYEYSQERNKK